MKLPQFTVKIDKSFDKNMCLEFLKYDKAMIEYAFPEIKNNDDAKSREIISNKINEIYLNKKSVFKNRVLELKKNKDKFIKVAEILSEITETDWAGIENITIIPSYCPIYPRFLDLNTFFVPFNLDQNFATKVGVHEMTHFIYFKKLKEVFPKLNDRDFDYPKPTWILSELLAPVIVNDSKIQKIINWKDDIYTCWQDIKVDGKNLEIYFTDIYQSSVNFEDFIKKATKAFEKLNISEEMIKKMS